MGVGPVDAGRAHIDDDAAVRRGRIGQVGQLQDLGATGTR